MLKKERQEQILKIITERKYCTVGYLAGQLYVAPITIRRDLTEMEAAGLITRCFGGATVPEYENREVPYELRNKSHTSTKESLARRAVRLICPGDVVFLDASSTVSHMAELLPPELNTTVITNSMLVAERLKERHIRCYLTGGTPVENSYALVGNIAERTLADLYANICFFSAQGVDERGVISDQSEGESALRRVMIRNSDRHYFLVDSSKYPKRFAFRICEASSLDGVITDLETLPFPAKVL